ncbi:ABC transporter ATP-binding protein [Piscinibacter sakaiensis]|uniref:Sugar ABC transporter, ATP-binding protein n=1 Tax=Piscinibacter sakaiensis TaxID=1547922 RepID=A0A0K8P7X2_PISS1|nr:ABC transporter ATP-binding protein [Piscinibacter sakaiensis]GAP38624.1 sugar ABC transporter, ATP-binding protein [Piscinibacter sakaiensis]
MSPAAADAADAVPALALRHVSKRFGTLVANDDISLGLGRGEVLALLGENGAGKSTLVSILFGHYRADAGEIEVFGRRLPPGDARAALDAGIGMVHQHFTLADNLSVLDNVMLGTEPLWRLRSRRAAARARLLETAARFGLQVDPQARVGALSVGERQRVEILKALLAGGAPGSGRAGTRILILDEPTAVLTPAEVDQLFATLRRLVADGLSLIFISHKLDEVLRIADRIAVLRAGRLVADRPAAGATPAELAEWMVGRRVAPAQRRAVQPGEVVCALKGVGVRSAERRAGLSDVDLAVRAGEIVAIAGVSGNGQQALAELLFGLRRADTGEVLLRGRALPASPRAWVAAGVARIPADRQATGVVGDLPLWENAILEHHDRPPFARAGWVRRGAAQAHARTLVQAFDVRGTEAQGVATPTRGLSGGNMQKLILGRALRPPVAPVAPSAPAPVPTLIVADQPTWGLDVGAVAYVHQALLDACAQGAAVLLVCEDLEEIFAIADRVAVMHQGRLTPARPLAEWTLAGIGLAMAGGPAD